MPEYLRCDVLQTGSLSLTAVDYCGNESNSSWPLSVTGGDEVPVVPDVFALYQNVPNPFNPHTVIKFDLPSRARVVLRIYNVTGQLVRTLADNAMDPGRLQVTWNGRDDRGSQVASGVYFYMLNTGTVTRTKKMIMLK